MLKKSTSVPPFFLCLQLRIPWILTSAQLFFFFFFSPPGLILSLKYTFKQCSGYPTETQKIIEVPLTAKEQPRKDPYLLILRRSWPG